MSDEIKYITVPHVATGEPEKVPTSNPGGTSDGYHTFDELYAHRVALFIALMMLYTDTDPFATWWTEKHHDGTMFEGWLLAGIDMPEGRITYHVPASEAPRLRRTGARQLARGPEWDGHTPEDVVTRLRACVEN